MGNGNFTIPFSGCVNFFIKEDIIVAQMILMHVECEINNLAGLVWSVKPSSWLAGITICC